MMAGDMNIQDLLAENQALRTRLATLEAENAQLGQYISERLAMLAEAEALAERYREALERAKGDMIWMFGAWDGSMKDEDVARPIAQANIAAIDEALADQPKESE